MRNAWFGTNALIILAFNGLMGLLHVLEVFPYFYTLFYPLFCLLPLLIALMGAIERDKHKTIPWIAVVLSAGMLIHWVFNLLFRLQIL